MGRHDAPSTGTGRSKGNGPKPAKTQITQVNANGANLTKLTAKLWGIFSGKAGR